MNGVANPSSASAVIVFSVNFVDEDYDEKYSSMNLFSVNLFFRVCVHGVYVFIAVCVHSNG